MRKLSVYWYRTTDNFGDAFSPMAVAHCFGCEVVPGGKRDADLVAEGSVLDFALLRDLSRNPLAAVGTAIRAAIGRCRRPLLVWGSGMLFPLDRSKREIAIRRPSFLAIRGELTRREMIRCGLLEKRAELALGDPGLFMSDILSVPADTGCGRGFVMHAYHWTDGTATAFHAEHPEIRLIDPRRPPQEVVRDIASCSEIFSSSLHGLVAADAFGIPNRWVALETPFADARRNRFKFDDYYSALGERREPCGMRDMLLEDVDDPIDRDRIAAVKRALRDTAVLSCQ